MNYPPINRIEDVVSALDSIIAQSMKANDASGYFASLYRRMTLAVSDGIKKGAFENGERMERLDIIFAKRYLDAYHQYKTGVSPSSAWKLAFDCAKANESTTIQHLLLGINAHINLDLGIAAATLCPDKSIFNLKKDFDTINVVISSLVQAVQSELEKIWFPMQLINKITGSVDDEVVNFSIGMAREAAWKVATDLAMMPVVQHPVYIKRLDESVTRLGIGIQKPPFVDGVVLKLVRLTEVREPRKVIALLNK